MRSVDLYRLLFKYDPVPAMLAHEADVDPQGAAAVVAVGDSRKRCVDVRCPAFIRNEVHRVGAVAYVQRHPAPRLRTMSHFADPLRGCGIRKRLPAKFLAEIDGLPVGEDLVAIAHYPDDPPGVPGD